MVASHATGPTIFPRPALEEVKNGYGAVVIVDTNGGDHSRLPIYERVYDDLEADKTWEILVSIADINKMRTMLSVVVP